MIRYDVPQLHAQAPAIVAFRDALINSQSARRTLATQGQVGAVYGLAYDWRRGHLYASAFHRRGHRFGPGGPGRIYRVDLASGGVVPWANLPAGPDRHQLNVAEDAASAAWVGGSAIGDIEIDDAGTALFAVNLFDRRIYRFALPDVRLEGSFAHGAAGSSWAQNARPFGLGYRDGWLYHAVVDSGEVPAANGPFDATLYRSRPDGAEMTVVAEIDLRTNYARGRPAWNGLTGAIVADIVFRPNGAMVLGLRRRSPDMNSFTEFTDNRVRFALAGDVLPLARSGERWIREAGKSFESRSGCHYPDFSTVGGLAMVPGLDLLVSSALQMPDCEGAGAFWFDGATGKQLHREPIIDRWGEPGLRDDFHSLGDVESLCPPFDATVPGADATGTAFAATATIRRATAVQTAGTRVAETRAAVETREIATRAASMTHVAGTAAAAATATETAKPPAARTGTTVAQTATAVARATNQVATASVEAQTATAEMQGRSATAVAAATTVALKPELIVQGCRSDNPHFVMTIFNRALTPEILAIEPAVVAFNDTPDDDLLKHMTLATQSEAGATFGVATDHGRAQVYVGAYHKRGTIFGPGGPGQVYRIDLRTRAIIPWAALDAGPDHHAPAVDFDQSAAGWVGKVGLGDIELDTYATTLFVMNLFDRRIHRFRVPDGAWLGAFAHGAAAETWAQDARPFGLGFRDGWLYHGVVDAREAQGRGGAPTGMVFRSRADGSEMTEVARFDFSYLHDPPWGPWATVDVFDSPSTAQPMLSDIEFRPGGDLVLGIRDRLADVIVWTGFGDLLSTRRVGDRWEVVTVPERYQDQWIHDESPWGTLAALSGLDGVITSALAPMQISSGGAAWFDNQTGLATRRETLYTGTGWRFNKSNGLGDIEALCLPADFPTATPSATSTAVPTATPTALATATATVSPTTTPRTRRIYLPLTVGEVCPPALVDVVLVLDMSTSMVRQTRGGRSKHAAAVEAAGRFVDLLHLPVGSTATGDRAAIVGFNRSAWIEQPLTADVVALKVALARLSERIDQHTRLDLALERGAAASLGTSHRPTAAPVVILLTDGLPNQVPPAEDGRMETTVLRAAADAKRQGVIVYTVGLGAPEDIDAALLRDIADDPSMYADAPDGEDLAAIYATLAARVRCAPGRHSWWEGP